MTDDTVSAQVLRRQLFAGVRRGVVAVVIGHPDKKHDYGPMKGPPKSYFAILGTGFVYDARGLVLSAGHVLDRAHEFLVIADHAGRERPDILCVLYQFGRRDEDGDWVSRFQTKYVINSYRPPHGDVAVLALGGAGEDAPYFPLELASDPCQLGDAIFTCGFPLGLELHDNTTVNPSFAAGIIGSILPDHEADPEARTRLQLDTVAHGGSSGGPVCDLHTGRVVGMTVESASRSVKLFTARDQTIQIPLGISFAEDVSWIRQVTAAAVEAFDAGIEGPIHQRGRPDE